MNVVNMRKYTVFILVCFLSLIGLAYAKDPVLYLGEQTSISGVTSCNANPGSTSLQIEPTDSGVNLKFQTANAINDQRVVITCTNEKGKQVKKAFTLNNTPKEEADKGSKTIKAYWGAGTCSFSDSRWHTDSYTTNGKVSHYSAIETGTEVELGSCTPDADPSEGITGALEFAGWIKGVSGAYQSVKTGPNACAGAQKSVTVDSGDWGACYKDSTKLVRISNAVPNSTINASGGWNLFKSSQPQLGYFHKGASESETIALPSLTISGDEDVEYVWVSGDKELAPGSAVPHDNSVWIAKIKRDELEDNTFYRSVYVNETTALIPIEGTPESCSSASSYVSAELKNGECQVTGLDVTPSGEYGDVFVTVGGKNMVYKFSVESKVGNSQNGDEDFVIDTSSNIIIGKNDESSEDGDFQTNSCEGFKISHAGDSSPFANDANGNGMTSAKYNVESQCKPSDTNRYVALCLDPGRNGPGPTPVYYKKSSKIKSTSDLGLLIAYLARNSEALGIDFEGTNDPGRIGAHVAARVVAINSGYSAAVDSSDLKYKAHYEAYAKIAKALKAGTDGDLAVNEMTFLMSGVKEKAGEILKNYKSVNLDLENKLTREISETEGTPNGDGYTLTYTGKFKIPSSEEDSVNFSDACENSGSYGVTCKKIEWTLNNEESAATGGILVYDYKVELQIADALNVKAPKTKEEQKDLSFKLTYKGNNSIDNIFIAEPADGSSFSLQRMIVFNLNENQAEVYVYFPIGDESLCDQVPALSQSSCPGSADDESAADNCKINKQLYKESNCCRFVTDETSYLFNSVCGGNCTVSTLAEICTFNPDEDGTTDKYIISEGRKNNGAGTGSAGEEAIGECVVNVTDNLKPDQSNKTKFEYTDDNGNPINDEHYDNNRYCRVTCKEDWDIQMDNFGSLVGENAVAAGTYFTDGSSVFLSAKRTCYTNYIDYDAYNKEEADMSRELINQYDIYSLNSHIYTDIHRQQGLDLDGEAPITKQTKSTGSSSGCLQYATCTQSYGSNYSSFSSTKKQCYKPKTCTQAEKDAGKTDCNDYKGAPKCAFRGTGLSYSLETTHQVEQLINGEDVTYNPKNPGGKETPAEGSVLNADYDDEMIAEKRNNAKAEYKSSATLKCTVTPAEVGSGTTGDYKCTLTVTDYKGGTTTEDIVPACPNNKYVQNTTTVNGNTITLNAKFKDKTCQYLTSAVQSQYNKYENPAWTDSKNNKSPFQIMSDKMKKIAEDYTKSARSQMTSLHYNIYKYDRDMYNCQHFQLYNNSDEGMNCQVKVKSEYKTGGDADETSLGEDREYITINSDFDPTVSYTYDEDGFMTILQDDNILVQYTEKNDMIYEKADTGDPNTTSEVGGINGKVNSTNESDPQQATYSESCGVKVTWKDEFDNEYDIPHDHLETKYYNPDSKWEEDSNEEKTYGGDSGVDEVTPTKKTITLCTVYGKKTGDPKAYWVSGKEGSGYTAFTPSVKSTPEWNGGHCYKVTLRFLKAHYIKESIGNGSFYKTKGSWYLRASDIKEHGDDIGDALDKAQERSMNLNYPHNQDEYDYWALLGTGYNVFPVAMTTPRNLYQYTYYFGDIGSFGDGSLGRIMGKETSIISLNKHICFYEVYEELCKCCGDEINTHYEESSDYEKTEEAINNYKGQGYDYTLSDLDKIKINTDGSISFSTSSVALGDMDSDTNRNLGTNWVENAPFYYNGNNFTTNKGANLKGIIEKQGETIYEVTDSSDKSMVEYHFELTTDTMSKIREYNRAHGYEIDYKNLKVYGRYTIGSINGGTDDSSFKTDNDDEMNNKYSTFQHLGSTFLEELNGWDGVVMDGTLSQRTDEDNVCYVLDSEMSNPETAAALIREKIKGSGATCRWIDYIETNGSNTDCDGNQVTTRLSFK